MRVEQQQTLKPPQKPAVEQTLKQAPQEPKAQTLKTVNPDHLGQNVDRMA